MKLRNSLAVCALGLGLSACGPLIELGSDGPPPPLFALRAAPQSAQKAALPSPLLVQEPETIAELELPRIAVYTSATSVSYLPQSRWVDPPARLVARLLEDRLREASTGLVLGPRQFELSYEYRLISRLTDFHVVAKDGAHVGRVGLEVSLLSSPADDGVRSQIIGSTRLVAERSLTSVDPQYVTEQLNDAANDVAGQLIAWLATQRPAAAPGPTSAQKRPAGA